MARSDWISLGALFVAIVALALTQFQRITPPDLQFAERWSVNVYFTVELPSDDPFAFPDTQTQAENLKITESICAGNFPGPALSSVKGFNIQYRHTVSLVNVGQHRATKVKVEIADALGDGAIKFEGPGIYNPTISNRGNRKVVELPELHASIPVKIHVLHGPIKNLTQDIFRRWKNRPTKVIHVVSNEVNGRSTTRDEDKSLKCRSDWWSADFRWYGGKR